MLYECLPTFVLIGAAVIIHSVTGQVTTSSSSALLGQSATLKCSFDGSADWLVAQWIRKADATQQTDHPFVTITRNSGDGSLSPIQWATHGVDPNFRSRVTPEIHTVGNTVQFNIQISGLSGHDVGDYECEVVRLDGLQKSQTSLSAGTGSVNTGGCPNGGVLYPTLNYCYWKIETSQDAFHSAALCGHDQGTLASIPDHNALMWLEQNYGTELKSETNESVWIGVNDQVTEGEYLTWEGEPQSYFNWGTGQPSNNDELPQQCVQMFPYDDQEGYFAWADTSCSANSPALCYKRMEFSETIPVSETTGTKRTLGCSFDGSDEWYVAQWVKKTGSRQAKDKAFVTLSRNSEDGSLYPVEWARDGLDARFKAKVKPNVHQEGNLVHFDLVIDDPTSSDFGTYECVIVKRGGPEKYTIILSNGAQSMYQMVENVGQPATFNQTTYTVGGQQPLQTVGMNGLPTAQKQNAHNTAGYPTIQTIGSYGQPAVQNQYVQGTGGQQPLQMVSTYGLPVAQKQNAQNTQGYQTVQTMGSFGQPAAHNQYVQGAWGQQPLQMVGTYSLPTVQKPNAHSTGGYQTVQTIGSYGQPAAQNQYVQGGGGQQTKETMGTSGQSTAHNQYTENVGGQQFWQMVGTNGRPTVQNPNEHNTGGYQAVQTMGSYGQPAVTNQHVQGAGGQQTSQTMGTHGQSTAQNPNAQNVGGQQTAQTMGTYQTIGTYALPAAQSQYAQSIGGQHTAQTMGANQAMGTHGQPITQSQYTYNVAGQQPIGTMVSSYGQPFVSYQSAQGTGGQQSFVPLVGSYVQPVVSYQTVQSSGVCPSGGVLYTGLMYCYWKIDSKQDAFQSADLCAKDNGMLASIPDSATLDFLKNSYGNELKSHVDDGVWLGINDQVTEGIYKTWEGYPQTYFNWRHDEPNDDHNPPQQCVRMFPNDDLHEYYAWEDKPCSEIKPALCYKKMGQSASGIGPFGQSGIWSQSAFSGGDQVGSFTQPLGSSQTMFSAGGQSANGFGQLGQQGLLQGQTTFVGGGQSSYGFGELSQQGLLQGQTTFVGQGQAVNGIGSISQPMTLGYATITSEGCPTGSIFYKKRNYCYWKIDEHEDAFSSASQCGLNQGTLATIPDYDTLTWLETNYGSELKSHVNDGLWIGVTDRFAEGVYQTWNGFPQTFLNWRSDQPNDDHDPPQQCVLMFPNDDIHEYYAWDDKPCSEKKPALCYKDLGNVAHIGGRQRRSATSQLAVPQLSCYACHYLDNPDLCQYKKQCVSESLCMKGETVVSGSTLYYLDCLSKSKCENMTSTLTLNGHVSYAGSNFTSLSCCDTDNCNRHSSTSDVIPDLPVFSLLEGRMDEHESLNCSFDQSDEWFVAQWIRKGNDGQDTAIVTLTKNLTDGTLNPVQWSAMSNGTTTTACDAFEIENVVHFNLHISSLKTTDLGMYQCEVVKLSGPERTEVTLSDGGCPDGAILYPDLMFCYWKTGTSQNAFESASVCGNDKGTLASIPDMESLEFLESSYGIVLRNNVDDGLWIGVTDLTNEGDYTNWQSTPQAYFNWRSDQPNDRRRKQNCVRMFPNDDRREYYSWQDTPCSEIKPALCYKPLGSPLKPGMGQEFFAGALISNTVATERAVPGCPAGSVLYQPLMYCFWTIRTKQTAFQSAVMCGKSQGMLARIPDRDTMEFLKTQPILRENVNNGLWIGVTDHVVEGTYKTWDGQPQNFVYWRTDQPDDLQASQNCVRMFPNDRRREFYSWQDKPCSERERALCYKQLDTQGNQLEPLVVPNPSVGNIGSSTFSPVAAGEGCPPGSVLYKPFMYCFWKIDTQQNAFQSAGLCGRNHGMLARIQDADTMEFLKTQQALRTDTNSGLWIGVNDQVSEGNYRTWDGQSQSYFYWRSDQPNDQGATQNCVRMFPNDAQRLFSWQDKPCNERGQALCYKQISTPVMALNSTQPQIQIRLRDGNADGRSGRVEILENNVWGTMCDDGFGIAEATVVCRQLQKSGTAIPLPGAYFGQGTGSILIDDINCYGNENNLGACDYIPSGRDCDHIEDAGVMCLEDVSVPVRLVDGASANQGRVEVLYLGVWGTICNDYWDSDDATVVCSMLGYNEGGNVLGNVGDGKGPIWLDDVECTGQETNLANCSSKDWGEHNCDHTEDAGVYCYVPMSVDELMVSNVTNGTAPVDYLPTTSVASRRSCYSCHYIDNLEDCESTKICDEDSLCFQGQTLVSESPYYYLDCLSISSCTDISSNLTLSGNVTYAGSTFTDGHCCFTDNCNKDKPQPIHTSV